MLKTSKFKIRVSVSSLYRWVVRRRFKGISEEVSKDSAITSDEFTIELEKLKKKIAEAEAKKPEQLDTREE